MFVRFFQPWLVGQLEHPDALFDPVVNAPARLDPVFITELSCQAATTLLNWGLFHVAE